MQGDAGKNNILHARNVRKTRTETTQQIAVPHGVPCISGKRQPPSDAYCNMTSGLWVPLALYFWSVKMANVIRASPCQLHAKGLLCPSQDLLQTHHLWVFPANSACQDLGESFRDGSWERLSKQSLQSHQTNSHQISPRLSMSFPIKCRKAWMKPQSEQFF